MDQDLQKAAKALAQECNDMATKLVVSITQSDHVRSLALCNMLVRIANGVQQVLTTPNVRPMGP